jgi:3-mercaptopyruvate sulfurtransferase SseA
MKKRQIASIIFAVLCTLSIGFTGLGVVANPAQTGDGARRVTPQELRQLFKKGQAIVVDVRTEEAYKAGHIKGAWLIPAADIGNRADELPRNKLIATYCS